MSKYIIGLLAWIVFVVPLTYCTLEDGKNGAAMESMRLDKGIKPIEYSCAHVDQRDAAQAAVCAAYFSNRVTVE